MRTSNLTAVFSAVLTLAACSSASSPPQPPAATPTVPPVTTAPDFLGGYLGGELQLDSPGTPAYPLAVLLTEDGRFRALQDTPYFFPQTYLMLSGSFTLEGRLFAAEGIAIANPGQTWSDGQAVTTATMSGTLDQPTSTSNGQLLVTLTMESGDSGTIDGHYAVLSGYWYGSDFERLVGTWAADQGENGSWHPDPYGSAVPPLPAPGFAEIVVTADGQFTGSDDGGCEMAGRFSIIDARFSMWSIDYTITACDRAGSYSGLAVGDNHWYPVRSLSFTADDGSRSQSLEFWKSGS